MTEKEIYEIMQNIDDDLIKKEIEDLVNEIEIDMDSISKKAHSKFKDANIKKGETTMKNKKRYKVLAVALVAALSVSVVYASEISDFLKSFSNKKEIYSTVVEGDAFYLKSPFKLDKNTKIESIMFTKDLLEVEMSGAYEEGDKINILSGDTTYIPGGYGLNGDLHFLSFYNETADDYLFMPTKDIVLKIDEKSYNIELSNSMPVTAKGEILETVKTEESKEIDWINVGYKDTDKGMQILTSFTDENLKLKSIGKPVSSVIEASFDYEKGLSSSTSSLGEPLLGKDADGNVYTYDWDKNASGRPVTIFESDAPKDKEIVIDIPSIVIGYDYKYEFPKTNIEIPELNKELKPNTEIDFNVQKMILTNIKRTSETTATLTFNLNTGEGKESSIRAFSLASEGIKKADYTIENNICIMNITFQKDLKDTDVTFSSPNFEVAGNWKIAL